GHGGRFPPRADIGPALPPFGGDVPGERARALQPERTVGMEKGEDHAVAVEAEPAHHPARGKEPEPLEEFQREGDFGLRDAHPRAPSTGVSLNLIDSPQPQASATLGLLKRKPDSSSAGAESISVPKRNICALGAIITRAPSCSTTSSMGPGAAANSMVYSMPAQPPFLTPSRSPNAPSFAIRRLICATARGVRVTGLLPGMPNM